MTELIIDNRTLSTVIASQSRWRLNSLSAVVAAMPNVTIIGRVQDVATLLEGMSASRADLVILDTSMTNGDLASIIDRVKTLSPATAVIVIAQYRDGHYAMAEALADAVLLDGFPTEALADIIKHLGHSKKIQ